MTGIVGVAGGGVTVVVGFPWLFQVAAEGPLVAISGADGGLFDSWLAQHVERVLTAPCLPAVLGLSGIVMAAIGIVQFMRRR